MKTAKNIVSMPMPTKYGDFVMWVWEGERGQEPVALTTPNLDPNKEVMLRIHSECLTGDVFGSLTCDCGPQKDEALRQIGKHGNGILIYHRQEGRNMGLFKKVQAYNLMKSGADTFDANMILSGNPDAREYSTVVEMLDVLLESHRSKMLLLSNNPYKCLILERAGYPVSMQSLIVGETIYNTEYIQTKIQKFSHYSGGHKPYVGVTIYRSDIGNKQLGELLCSYDSKNHERKLFLGVAVFPENGNLKDLAFVEEFNALTRVLNETKGLSIVLHMTYSARRQSYRDLQVFLKKLKFNYSLQFRLRENSKLPKVDLELIESLGAENIIFQMNNSQYELLDDEKFVEYFRQSNHYILLDDSFGTGARESAEIRQSKILSVIKKGMSHISVAGGYDAEQLPELTKLEDYFKLPLSVDAESRLRSGGMVDVNKVQKYLSYFFK